MSQSILNDRYWFYADQNGNVVGPLALQELTDALASSPNALDTLVWRNNFTDWKRAADVPELEAGTARVLPPPLPVRRAISATNDDRKPAEQKESLQELEPTWQRAISVWWLTFWRGIIGGAIIDFGVGFIIGGIGWLAGMSDEAVNFAYAILGWPVGFVWLAVVWQMALRKHYRDFRLALIPYDPHRFKAQELEPTWRRAISVWWLVLWRALVGGVVIFGLTMCIFYIIHWFIGSPSYETIPPLVRFLGSFMIVFCWVFVWLIAVMQMALRKHYRDFRIAVVPLERVV